MHDLESLREIREMESVLDYYEHLPKNPRPSQREVIGIATYNLKTRELTVRPANSQYS